MMRFGGGSELDPGFLNAQLSEEEAKAFMFGGLGKFELEHVASYSAPLYWAVRASSQEIFTRNGTTFFLDAGKGPFGVTAYHVIEGWRNSVLIENGGPLRIAADGSSMALDWDARAIDAHPKIDIATFSISYEEIKALGKAVLTGYQKVWPPMPPVVQGGIYLCGYPGVATQHPSNQEVVFGAAALSGIATSVSERDVSMMIERERLKQVLGSGSMPENFNFGGISGGPMLTVVQNTLRSWALAGVIYQGPNTSLEPDECIPGFEVIRTRRAHFILPNGKLDVALWENLAL
jgi:hypothetical protein